MKKIFTLSIIGLCTTFLFSSCSHRLTDFTIISTKNIELSKADTYKKGASRTKGVDRTHIIITIPFGRPNLKEAIDKAIESTPGAVALVDGVVYTKAWWAILYGQSMVIVEGTPLVDPSVASMDGADNKIPAYAVAKLDREGNIKEYEEISEEDFAALKTDIVSNSQRQSFQEVSEIK